MKSLLSLLLVSLFMACSSAKKQPDITQTTAPTTPVVQDKTSKAPKIDSDIIKKEICESGEDKRFLEVHKKPNGCDLSYKKFGKEKVVATGKFGIKHCEDSLNKIAKKLEADKFDCREN